MSFDMTSTSTRNVRKNKKGHQLVTDGLLTMVPKTGVEPARPCEH